VEAVAAAEEGEGNDRSHHHSSSHHLESRRGQTDHAVRCLWSNWESRNYYHAARADSNTGDDREDADRIDPWLRRL
jgi:hypothetical protein